MKKPKKPAEPIMPFVPKAPTELMDVWRSSGILVIDRDERISALDLGVKIREALVEHGFSVDTLVSFASLDDCDYGDSVNVYAEEKKQVPNPHYKQQLKLWQKDAKIYAGRQEAYEKALMAYKEKLAKYHVELDAYNKWVREDEIKRLTSRLEQLKSGDIP